MDNDCLLKVDCMPQIGCRPLRLPLDHSSFAPFVEAKFIADTGQEVMSLTVGNESYSADPNKAVIKSMECGYMDKMKAVLEIVDEAGGEMGLFVDVLRKCGRVASGSTILLKFGWVKADCDGVAEDSRITFDGYVNLIVHQIDVSYSGGLVKYTVHSDTIDVVTTNQRQDNMMPSGMRLTEAIERICGTKGIIVCYASEDGDGNVNVLQGTWPKGLSVSGPATPEKPIAPWEWHEFGTDGPTGIWQGDNTDVLSTISAWIRPYRIKHGRLGAGIKMVFDSKEYNRLFLWKDPLKETRCSGFMAEAADRPKAGGVQRGYLGTFIVNGGKCSPVIRFDPKFNFIAGLARQSTGGNASGENNSASVLPETQPDPGKRFECVDDEKRTGQETDATITQSSKQSYPPNRVTRESLRSDMAHVKANMYGEFTIGDIQAEMTIMGNPTNKFVDFLEFMHAPVSVIVMNPFHIVSKQDGNECGDWAFLSKSGCNQILSDSRYICQGVNHSIKEGSYTTTLRLQNTNKITARLE